MSNRLPAFSSRRAYHSSAPVLAPRLATLLAPMLAAAALAALSGCATRGGPIPYDVKEFGPPDASVQQDSAYDMPLGPLDMLRINFFRVPDLSGEYQVDARGMLMMPLVGAVSVRDKNPEQFAAMLEQIYGEKYLNHPDISIRVQGTNSHNITVEGGVNRPGIFALPGKTTLLGVVALAGGVNINDANPKRVAIFRKRDGKTQAAAFDLLAIRHGQMGNPLVYPGDTVVVDTSQLRALYRDLLQTLPVFAVFSGL